ncbi:protein-disulfide reductase DsbD N-terminal domain-containing protein [Terriglobus sp.]|uniref:protein-disulfide reductase DsbD N-terminal domain-containing protein n=1 Tax=Terriglobus sp. TaxID=1889013 RepID=UPI003AFFED01
MQAVSTRTRVTYAICFATVLMLAFAAMFLVVRRIGAQAIDLSQSSKPAARGHVQFAAEPQIVAANKPATVLLHFHVDPGFHINSHTPKSEMLIPTRIAIGEGDGIKVQTVDFPAGQPYSFSFEPQTKLDVYTNDVVLTAHVVAQPGQRTLIAVLKYQACDAAACYPPKTLPVEQPFTAK